jgi:hypothetical protein
VDRPRRKLRSVIITTIACNKEEICGDLQLTNQVTNTKHKCGSKVFKFKAHELTFPECDFYMGFAGTAEDLMIVSDFFSFPEAFSKPPKTGKITGLVLTEKKEIFVFESYNKWIKVSESFCAIGSGANIALGAMAAGATPTEAIKYTSKLDVYTGMGYKTFKVN